MANSIKDELIKQGLEANVIFADSPTNDCGTSATGILLFAETIHRHRIAASTVFELPQTKEHRSRTETAKLKGVEVVQKLVKQLAFGGIVDEYMVDQIVIFMALASSGLDPCRSFRSNVGRRRSEILVGNVSTHAQTAMRISEIMLGNIAFSTEHVEGVGMIMVCERRV